MTSGSVPSTAIASRPEVLLLLLGLEASGVSPKGIGGITRLQKLLFLLWKEAGIREVGADFEFKPYKAGPYSRRLYDELELLENVGLVRSEVQGESTSAEVAELEALSFEDLMGNGGQTFADLEVHSPETFEERRYSLTEKGLAALNKILTKESVTPFVDGIRRIKTKFGNYSLQDLLYHVYTKYDNEGWTSESEIRDQVLAKGRKR